MPEISVIMLTYNRRRFLERSIPSVLNQTWKDFEYIIVDNGSDDGSAAYCDWWAQKDERVKVIHMERSNIGAGRNAGLDAAVGRYVTFVDDDDRMTEDMLEFLYMLAKKHDADISICGSWRENEEGVFPKYVFSEELVYDKKTAIHELLERKKFNAGFPTKLFKREKFLKVRFSDQGRYDDIGACYRFFAQAEKVAAKGEPKYYCYRHAGNNSAFTTNDSLLSEEQLSTYLDEFRQRTEYLSGMFPDEAPYYRYTEWSYMISMCHKLLAIKKLSCQSIYEEMKKALMTHWEEIWNGPYTKDFERGWLSEIEKGDM